MKGILLLTLLTLNFSAYSFESGRYHGEKDQQVCDIDLVQTETTLTFNSIDCIDNQSGLETHLDNPVVMSMGHYEDWEAGYYKIIDVSNDSYKMSASHLRTGDVIREGLAKTADGKIHYNFSISYMTNIFNLDLSK